MKRCIVIGLGNFGFNTALTLYKGGVEVVGVDNQNDIVSAYKDLLGVTICADATSKEQLEQLQIAGFDAAVVAIGQDITASILIALYLNELSVKQVVVRAISNDHAKVLEKVGVDEIVYPELDTAIKTANKLMLTNVADYLPISKGFGIVEITPPNSFFGKSLIELNITGRFHCQIIGIKHFSAHGKEGKTIIAPKADDTISADSKMIVLGKTKDIKKLQNSH